MKTLPLVLCAVVLVSCGTTTTTSGSNATSSATNSASSTAATTQTTTGTTQTTTATSTTVTDIPRVKVEDGVKDEGLDILSVRVGAMVRFEVEADVTDEVHVHGYDLIFETTPGQEVLIEFLADATGIFEVELEGLGLKILDIEVTP